MGCCHTISASELIALIVIIAMINNVLNILSNLFNSDFLILFLVFTSERMFCQIIMRLAENESRLVGMKFEALVELSQERSDVGSESQILMRLKFHKRSEVKFKSRIIPHA